MLKILLLLTFCISLTFYFLLVCWSCFIISHEEVIEISLLLILFWSTKSFLSALSKGLNIAAFPQAEVQRRVVFQRGIWFFCSSSCGGLAVHYLLLRTERKLLIDPSGSQFLQSSCFAPEESMLHQPIIVTSYSLPHAPPTSLHSLSSLLCAIAYGWRGVATIPRFGMGKQTWMKSEWNLSGHIQSGSFTLFEQHKGVTVNLIQGV